MSNSPSFPNMPTDQSLPDIGMSNPNNSAVTNASAGGKTLIRPSATAPHVGEQVGYGYMSPALKDVGQAPGNGSGVMTDNNGQGNSSGIPAAQPVPVMTYGDPNNSAIDKKEDFSPDGIGESRYGFGK